MIQLLGNHLWQSTLCAALAGLLTLVLRQNRAQVRYGIWLASSLKFLLPFAALVAVGGQLGWQPPASTQPLELTQVISTVSQPFSPADFDVAEHGCSAPVRARRDLDRRMRGDSLDVADTVAARRTRGSKRIAHHPRS